MKNVQFLIVVTLSLAMVSLSSCYKPDSIDNSELQGLVEQSCGDGVQSGGETGVDCGGPCPPCFTCDDGVLNQGETFIDCGGPCPPC